jgi:glycosyltransferase involved in cell wall biosynthesis
MPLSSTAPPKVAIVHDWVVSMRGGERVLESLCRIWPKAHVYTLRYDAAGVATSPDLVGRQFHPSFVDVLARRLPLGAAEFRMLWPLFPLAIESFDLTDYDLVISSSHAVAKGALAPPRALHVSYVHSPMRYIWEAETEYGARVPGGPLGRAAFGLIAHYMRMWDTASTTRIDALVSNSRYTAERVRRCYGRDSTVIEPPVDAARFARVPDPPPPDREDAPYLCVSALVPYKRVELAVRAFAGRRARLVVVGEGAERARLVALGLPNVELRGRVSDAELERLFGAARAIVHPAIDDFGIVSGEALAAGRPVIAFAGGGALDVVRDGETGVLFREPTAASLGEALDRFERARFEPARLREAARRFDRTEFERRFADFVDARLRASSSSPSSRAAAR